MYEENDDDRIIYKVLFIITALSLIATFLFMNVFRPSIKIKRDAFRYRVLICTSIYYTNKISMDKRGCIGFNSIHNGKIVTCDKFTVFDHGANTTPYPQY